ncbi:MAG TPA: hypothetical protein VLS25_02460 [Dehalococcoidia bacterium]|nr:hypothetical protein [Dehalococcoidia bacterium]
MGFDVYRFEAGKASWSAFGLPLEGDDAETITAANLARRDPPSCRIYERLQAVLERFTPDHGVCVVLSEGGVFLGRIGSAKARRNASKTAGDAMEAGTSTFRPDVPIMDMADWFRRRPKSRDFVITTPDGRVWGVLYRRDVDRLLAAANGHEMPAGKK